MLVISILIQMNLHRLRTQKSKQNATLKKVNEVFKIIKIIIFLYRTSVKKNIERVQVTVIVITKMFRRPGTNLGTNPECKSTLSEAHHTTSTSVQSNID